MTTTTNLPRSEVAGRMPHAAGLLDLELPSPRALRSIGLSRVEFIEACARWRSGAPVFGLWASQHVRPWDVATYGQLIALIRAAIGDDTDDAQEEPPCTI